jgi:ankyrin repeat protein
LDQGADINAIGPDGIDLLAAAVICKSKSVLELLLQYGADVNAKYKKFGTVLTVAAYTGFLDGVQVLLDAGASINYAGPFGTALQLAAYHQNEDIVKLLLQFGANPNAEGWPTKKLFEDTWGVPVQKRHCKIFSILLNSGLKVEIEDWRYIHERSIEDIRKCEAELSKHRTPRRSQQLEEAKSFLESFEALPQWQAVKDIVLSN